jgi:hypothetical protein
MNGDPQKVKIHLKTYIRFAKAYGRISTPSDFESHPIVYAFSGCTGKILAYPSPININPGSWYLFGVIGFPFYCDGGYKGILKHDGDMSLPMGETDTMLKDSVRDCILFEIEIVPDDVSEDISVVMS